MFQAYSRYADFSGRSGRKEFWLFQLLWFIVAIVFYFPYVISTVSAAVNGDSANVSGIAVLLLLVYGIFSFGSFIPALAVTVRRLHDTDHSGWFYFLALIPIIGPIILLVWFCQGGTMGANRFGSPHAQGGMGSAGIQPSHPAPPAGNNAVDPKDALQRLEQLGRLRDQGVLTDEEFALQKAAALKAAGT
ncbi:MAG: DUF805 domain-containing protein [Caulobacteraceae bacterium]